MKVIFLSNSRRKSRTFELGRSITYFGVIITLALPAALGLAIGLSFDGEQMPTASDGIALNSDISRVARPVEPELDAAGISFYREQLASAEERAQHKVQALAVKLAQLQARMLRLDAVGERVTDLAGLDKGEFNFGGAPAIGGPEQPGQIVEQAEISGMFDDLESQLDHREHQLDVLKDMMGDRNVRRESTIAGLPVAKGWLSSGYGMLSDPFNGRKTRHKGVDFAGKEGSDVIAVAAGFVTQSQAHKGFGRIVEIDHGDGLVTRYAHNRKNLVKAGDLVKKGQVIAQMGKTGRSTGPHVHFEVYKNGSVVNPARYIHRTVL